MGTPLSVDSVGGAISVSHLDLTPEESVVLNRLTEQVLAEEDKIDFYGKDYSPPEWYGKQHGTTPILLKIAKDAEAQRSDPKPERYPVVLKNDVQPKAPSSITTYKIRKS